MKLSGIDFLFSPSQSPTAWWILAAGALSLAASLAIAYHWLGERDEALKQEQVLIDAQQSRLKRRSSAEPTVAQRRRNQGRPELSKPWTATFAAIESATREPVYLLSMSIDPINGNIRLQGEAPTFDQALDYVQALGAEKAISSATLESHTEVSNSGVPIAPTPGQTTPNGTVVRFSAIAHWRQR